MIVLAAALTPTRVAFAEGSSSMKLSKTKVHEAGTMAWYWIVSGCPRTLRNPQLFQRTRT
jgi:hypothetical protein